MYIHVDHRWFKTFLKIDMKKLLALLLIVFSCQFSFAADRDEYWLQRDIQIGDGRNQYGKKVYGKAARAVMEDIPLANGTGSSVEQMIKRSIAADKPTAAKVGKSMLKRLYSPQAIVGTAAVTGVLAAIGWVMEDGIYIKKKIDGSKFKVCETYPTCNGNFITFEEYSIKQYQTVVELDEASLTKLNNLKIQTVSTFSGKCRSNTSYCINTKSGTAIFKPATSNEIKIPLSPVVLGTIMLGAGYDDPVDPFRYNHLVNTGDYTGVKEIYEHDPSGVGDELADAMDDKLKNAKPTDDSKPSWVGDPKYDDRPLAEDDKSSDRSWTEKGDEATGGTEPEKDPETGEATGNQSITIKFPLFCSWASKMCLWYDDWKASDKVYKDHMTKTEDHQGQEKTFWGSVKSWFDWTKENDDLDHDNDPPEIKDLDIGALDTSTFKGTPGCPAPIPVPVDFGSKGSVEVSYEPICQLASKWSFIAPLIGFISGAMIIVGVGRKGEDGEI